MLSTIIMQFTSSKSFTLPELDYLNANRKSRSQLFSITSNSIRTF